MAELRPYAQLPKGAAVLSRDGVPPSTGGWRPGLKPQVELRRCVDCLLCWLNCPDCAVLLADTFLKGFDYRFCKGCEICADVCPTGAITMVAETTPLPAAGAII